ncbi:hypothetical protein PU560_13035 [Georgenia sp. 10Sc9-8]|uniref:Nucleotidyltransferase domain-containing protein n=1 Tax=Georgenia halotolerans TaxID=3028317 RepID=A0ABT5TZ80_9MICO|nr:hypothetical protein [Georgenia halotolerans]
MTDDDRDALHDAIRMTAVALADADIRYALCGSYATWARGAPEPSHDADFVIREQDVDRAREAVAAAGLDVHQPTENWLFKAYRGPALVDVLFRMCGEPVGPEVFDRAEVLEVLAVRMPVLEATDVLSTQLRVLGEHYCDYSRLLPVARALREQIDWARLRREVGHSPYARAFVRLLEDLQVIEPEPAPAGAAGRPETAATRP